MTILDAYQLINEFFNKKTVLNLKTHFKEIVMVTENEEEDEAALRCALKDMETSGLLRSCSVGGSDYWILFKSLEAFSQQIELNYLLAAGISSVINNVCEVLQNEAEKSDPKNITEKDIKNLIFIASKVSPKDLQK
jgi:hypothetical protein